MTRQTKETCPAHTLTGKYYLLLTNVLGPSVKAHFTERNHSVFYSKCQTSHTRLLLFYLKQVSYFMVTEKVFTLAPEEYHHLLGAEYQHQQFFSGLTEHTSSGTLSARESKSCMSNSLLTHYQEIQMLLSQCFETHTSQNLYAGDFKH